jgi:glycine/D-amino acid oxidase-like deaminating enzyme
LQQKKIAVIGAGLAGLAVTRALVEQKNVEVHLFDPLGAGKGASQYALGLFNLFAGARLRLNSWGYAPLEATYPWLLEAESILAEKVILKKGIIKIATTEMQKKDFAEAAKMYEQIIPLEKTDHYLISSALQLNMEGYLKGLFQASLDKGLCFHKKDIHHLSELSSFDAIVVASGEKSAYFAELKDLVMHRIKGQILKGRLKTPLDYPLSSKVHLVSLENGTYILGATYEKEPKIFDVDQKEAMEELIPEVRKIYKDFDERTIISCHAGIRATTPQRTPYVGAVKKGIYVFAGLGSKGLLCHALLGKKLALAIADPEGEKYILDA